MTRADWIYGNLLEEAQSAPKAEKPSDLTVGVEVEAFLVDADHRPATQAASQALFHRLAGRQNWLADPIQSDTTGPLLPSVRQKALGGAQTVFKYDHAPHLLELAIGPFNELGALGKALEIAVAEVQSEAAAAKHQLVLQPALTGRMPESPLTLFRRLRETRRRAREAVGLGRSRSAENYAASIAALQLHVGGLHWAERTNWIETLYSFEPDLLAHGVLAVGNTHAQRRACLRRRWTGYRNAFPGNPLIGFPDLAHWTLVEWSEALSRAPLLIGPPTNAEPDSAVCWDEFRSRVRDLQIIRPRAFGTIEFRADPIQPTVAANLRLCALRLGLCAALFEGPASSMSFPEARARWWSGVDGRSTLAYSDRLVAKSRRGLEARGFGEARLLDA